MFPIIDRKRTGIRLRRVMDERGLSVKDVQQGTGTMFLRISLIRSVNVLVLITKDLIKQHKFSERLWQILLYYKFNDK